MGSMNFQAKFISWSMRRRGSVPRIQMKTQMSTSSLAKNQIHDGTQCRNEKRRGPSAEKERDAEAGDREHAEVFAEEEQREFEAGIFGVVAGDHFGLAFGQIERRAIGLGRGGDHEHDEAGESPRREDEPVRQDPGVAGPALRRSRRGRASRSS